MYNIVEWVRAGNAVSPQGIGSGYVMTFGDTRVYFSSDTDARRK